MAKKDETKEITSPLTRELRVLEKKKAAPLDGKKFEVGEPTMEGPARDAWIKDRPVRDKSEKARKAVTGEDEEK